MKKFDLFDLIITMFLAVVTGVLLNGSFSLFIAPVLAGWVAWSMAMDLI